MKKLVALILALLSPLPLVAATVVKSIGTSSRDYSTVTLWEAAITSATYPVAGTTAQGEMYADSNFDEAVTLDASTTNVTAITLTVPTAERHDGTAGTGVRFLRTATTGCIAGTTATTLRVEWIEFDMNGQASGCISRSAGSNTANSFIVANVLIHGAAGNHTGAGVGSNARAITVINSFLYAYASTSGTGGIFGLISSNDDQFRAYNNTLYKYTRTNASGGGAYGIYSTFNGAGVILYNNISMGSTAVSTTSAGGFVYGGTTVDDGTNMSDDDTADNAGGSGHLINKVIANQFVSTTAGSEDLHLITGSDAIDTGTDLVNTPSGVKDDIDNYDRDAAAVTWDMGADEFVSAGGGGGTGDIDDDEILVF